MGPQPLHSQVSKTQSAREATRAVLGSVQSTQSLEPQHDTCVTPSVGAARRVSGKTPPGLTVQITLEVIMKAASSHGAAGVRALTQTAAAMKMRRDERVAASAMRGTGGLEAAAATPAAMLTRHAGIAAEATRASGDLKAAAATTASVTRSVRASAAITNGGGGTAAQTPAVTAVPTAIAAEDASASKADPKMTRRTLLGAAAGGGAEASRPMPRCEPRGWSGSATKALAREL